MSKQDNKTNDRDDREQKDIIIICKYKNGTISLSTDAM